MEFDLLFAPARHVFQGQLQVVAQVAAPVAILGPPLGCATTEKLFKNPAARGPSERFTEDVERIVEPAACAASPPVASTTLREGRVPVPVVGGAFLIVEEDVVCLAQFLEFILRTGVARVFVGMMLDGKFAIGALHILGGSGALNA